MWWMHKEENTRPLWLLISGPSCVGKTTLVEQMIGAFSPQLQPVVTATTREKRMGEKEGKQYYFLSEEEYKKWAAEGKFLERVQVHGHWYGTPRDEVKKKLEKKCDCIMHIDWQGRQRLLELAQQEEWMRRALVSVFIRPPSMDVLRERLEKRGRNTAAEIEVRLETAARELPHAQEYDYVFTTGTYEQDFQQLKAIYQAEKLKV